MIIAPISAIPSWEGFVYQRHIALYIALKQIWSEIQSGNEEEVCLYKLGIEGVDDFSIIKSDKYISLHQVKEGAVNLKSDDKACFVISKLQYEAESAFFHINPSISMEADFVKETLEFMNNLISDLGKVVRTKEEIQEEIKVLEVSLGKKIDKDHKFYKEVEGKYIVVDIINQNSTKGSLNSILKYVSGGNKKKDNVVKAIKKALEELSEYKDMLNDKRDSDIWSIYDERFATSAEVIKKSCDVIEQILKSVNPEGEMYYDEIYYQFVYDKIDVYSQEVISAHNSNSKKNTCQIEFADLIELINRDHKNDSNTTDYMYFELFKLIKDTFDKYPSSRNNICISDDCNDCDKTDECNLFQQMLQISNKNYPDKKDFLYKLLLRTPNINLPRDVVINKLFIALLKKIDRLKYCDSNVLLAKNDSKIYRLTLDESEDVEDFDEQLNRELNMGSAGKFLIYESDVLITDRLNEKEYRYNQSNFNIIGEQELEELEGITSDSLERQKKNYNKSKVMRIISKDIAEGELI